MQLVGFILSFYLNRILTEGNVHTIILEINHLDARDSGDYKLKAKNTFGEADSIIKLNIETQRSNK